ncbi:MAG: ATP-binding protein, partial [Candidatus Methylomirabilales bacterium]
YRVDKAYAGEEALRKVQEDPPDLILLDIMMPKLDGYEICRRLKADEKTLFIPIVMITALKEPEERIQGIIVGADDFLTKPFNKLELMARVRSLLRVKKLHDQVEAQNRLLEQRVAERTAQLQEALRELQELDRLKTEFLQNISHELRTPLTPIKGYLGAILQEALGPLSPGQREGLLVVRESVERLQQLIDDLLAYVRIEAGRLKVETKPVSLPELLKKTWERFLPLAQDKGQTLTFSIPSDLPPVLADPEELYRAVSHLLDNALKFTPNGGRITVTARRVPSSEFRVLPSSEPAVCNVQPGTWDFVEVSITDTGIGIPAGKLHRIFDRFYQVDGSITREHGGMGIGLAIVKQVLEAHGASIEVESEEGRGSTFRFRLPLTDR